MVYQFQYCLYTDVLLGCQGAFDLKVGKMSKNDEEEEKPQIALDEGDIALLKTYVRFE
jgi:hypothetical protein